MKTIDVIIVNYYSEELVKQCISALKNSDAQGFNLNVIIVSNGTKDNKLLLSFKNDYTSVIDLGYNSGFGKACNIAAKKSSSDYLLFLNPDTLIKKDTLKLVLSMAEQNNYAVLGCKQINKLNKVQRSCSRELTPIRYLYKILKLNKLFPFFFKSYQMSDWDHLTDKEVNHVIGSFYFIENKVFKKVNGFDDKFFMYYEDLDLSKRITDLGEKIFYYSKASIFHEGGGVSNDFKVERLFYSWSSILIYSKKHFSTFNFIMMKLMIYILEPFIRLGELILKMNFSGMKQLYVSYKLLYSKTK